MRKTPNMKYETPKDPAKAGPTGQGERESNSRSPVFEFFKIYLFFNLSNNIGKIFIFS